MSLAVRAAIRLHPAAWRERYADEVLGTLADVADARGGRVSLAETVPLGLRGLWLRARSSVTFWAGLMVIVLLTADAATADVGYLDGSLTDFLLRLNAGIGYALPVLAIASGWAGARARTEGLIGPSKRLRRLWSDSWPLLAFTAFGFLLALTVLTVRAGPLWFTSAGILVIIGQIAAVLISISIGQMLGAVLPRVLVIFAAPAAVLAVGLLMLAWPTPWNLAPWGIYSGIAYVFQPDPFLRVYAIAGVIVVTAILVVCIRSVWMRAVPTLLVIGIAFGVAAQPGPFVPVPTFAERPHSELVCSTVEPIICLWPEQEAAFGAALRPQLAEAYARATALGLPVDAPGPRSVLQFGMTGIPAPADADLEDMSNMGLGTAGIGPEDLLGFYAFTFPSCCWEKPTSGEGEYMAVSYATSILLGVPSESVWVAMPDPYTGERLFDPSGIPDEATARALVEKWLTEGVNGVRAPS